MASAHDAVLGICVTAFRPISPHAAIQILDAADIGADLHRLLANLAMAGLVKGYARLIESETIGQPRTEIRDSRIDWSIWRRIVAEDRIPAVYDDASVHLDDDGAGNRVSIIGIRFDAASVNRAAAEHGAVPIAVHAPIVTHVVPPGRKLRPAPSPVCEEQMPFTVVAAPVVPAGRQRAVLDPGTVALSIQEAADVLGVCKGTVNNLIKEVVRGIWTAGVSGLPI
jgi:hypothetical protein